MNGLPHVFLSLAQIIRHLALDAQRPANVAGHRSSARD